MKSDLKTIYFPVEKVPSVELSKNSNMEYNSENAYAIVAKLDGNREKTLNYCSAIYKLIENASILRPLVPMLEEKFKSVNVYVRNDKDAQFSVRISPLVPSFSPKTEVIKPLITFTNSYDGKLLAQATGGLVTYLVDEKGDVETTYSTFLKGLSFAYTFKHSTDEIYTMEGIAGQVDEYIANFKKVKDQIAMMKQIDIAKPTSAKLEKLLRKLSKGNVFPLKEIETTIDRINYVSEIFGTPISLWTIYTAMNHTLETSDSSLTGKMRIDADAKIYVNILELM